MRRVFTTIMLVLVAAASAFGQTDVNAARAELYEGARLYREGQFAEAERHFRYALDLDPAGKNTRLFIARAVHQQYRPGDTSPENIAQAERAIKAYAVLLGDKQHGLGGPARRVALGERDARPPGRHHARAGARRRLLVVLRDGAAHRGAGGYTVPL